MSLHNADVVILKQFLDSDAGIRIIAEWKRLRGKLINAADKVKRVETVALNAARASGYEDAVEAFVGLAEFSEARNYKNMENLG